MARFELKLPQMGESVAEATLTAWLKDVGDAIEQEEGILEIATDKVDTEVPSEVSRRVLARSAPTSRATAEAAVVRWCLGLACAPQVAWTASRAEAEAAVWR